MHSSLCQAVITCNLTLYLQRAHTREATTTTTAKKPILATDQFAISIKNSFTAFSKERPALIQCTSLSKTEMGRWVAPFVSQTAMLRGEGGGGRLCIAHCLPLLKSHEILDGKSHALTWAKLKPDCGLVILVLHSHAAKISYRGSCTENLMALGLFPLCRYKLLHILQYSGDN